jgi:uncharacterized RDD family membrane protein YckC
VAADDAGWERTVRLSTPEGVDLVLPLAGAASRIAAFVIDYLVITSASSTISGLLVALIEGGSRSPTTGAAASLAVAGLLILGFFLYHAFFIAFGRGQSLGKKALKIRVVRADGGPAGLGRGLARSLLLLVDAFLLGPFIGVVSILSTNRRIRVGDLVAGTVVVREADRGRLPTLWLTGIPADAVSGWDTSAVPAPVIDVMNDWSARRRQFAPGSRAALATQLADWTRHLVPGVPPSLHPEAVVEGVLLSRWIRSTPQWRPADGQQGWQQPAWQQPAWQQPGWQQPAGAPPSWTQQAQPQWGATWPTR